MTWCWPPKFSFPPAPEPIAKAFRASISWRILKSACAALQTDYVDLYQVHCFDTHTPLEETLSALNGLVQQGKVRYIGCSNFAGWQLAKALGVSALGTDTLASTACNRNTVTWCAVPSNAKSLPLCRAERRWGYCLEPAGWRFPERQVSFRRGGSTGVAAGRFRSLHAIMG